MVLIDTKPLSHGPFFLRDKDNYSAKVKNVEFHLHAPQLYNQPTVVLCEREQMGLLKKYSKTKYHS